METEEIRALIALELYFRRANTLRQVADVKNIPPFQDEDFSLATSPIFVSQMFWAVALGAVIDGWTQLSLHDPIVDSLLLDSTNREHHKAFCRRSVQFDGDFANVLADKFIGEPMVWLLKLTFAFEDYFARNGIIAKSEF